jgi:hypothetical protein
MKLPSSLSQIESDPLRKSAARHDYSRVYGEIVSRADACKFHAIDDTADIGSPVVSGMACGIKDSRRQSEDVHCGPQKLHSAVFKAI